MPTGQLSVGPLPSPHPRTLASVQKKYLRFYIFMYFYALQLLGHPTEVKS